MAGGFERVLFLRDIEKETMSIGDIVARYNVSVNTARNWVKLDRIIKVEGSYPYLFTHADNTDNAPARDSVGGRVIPKDTNGEYIELHVVTTEQLDAAIPNLMNSTTTLGESLSGITSERDLLAFEAKMISAIQVARRYYEKDVKD